MEWTVPNMLTLGRVIAAPCVALCFVLLPRPLADWLAFALFTGAAVTDFFDGYLARRLGQESAFGKMLDPIADKAMVVIALFTLAFIGFGAEWLFVVPAVVILLREVLVSGLREFLGDVKLPVTQLAKWKTTAQLCAIGGFLFLAPFHAARATSETAASVFGAIEGWIVILLWVAAGLTLLTGWDYFRKGLAHIAAREGTR